MPICKKKKTIVSFKSAELRIISDGLVAYYCLNPNTGYWSKFVTECYLLQKFFFNFFFNRNVSRNMKLLFSILQKVIGLSGA